MDFRILGPLEVLDGSRAVALGGSRQRALLAVLLLHANETLAIERLVDELWGERPPPGAAKTVQVRISRLRKALGAGGTIATRERGYELVLDPERIDASRFEQLLADGGHELNAGRPAAAAEAFERALALWRGAPLTDLAYEPFAQAEIARLEELRQAALEQQVDAELALGRHAAVVVRLPALIAAHPYRERLHAQLMLALYRCDRQADALQAFQDARRLLVDELGIEPGERLRELERAILAQDPALALPIGAPPPDGVQPPPAVPESHPTPQTRRLVSVIFADLAGTAERLDPESLHAALDRSAAICAGAIERHGGMVERYAGGTVVGIFGLPALHEDDALRATRAALELRDAVAAELATTARVGVDSGEVFVTAERMAGDVMTVARRLQEAAADGEILVGERAHRLTRQHVRAEPIEPLTVRGVPIGAWRLRDLGAAERAPSRTPLIDRESELAELRTALARAGDEQTCRLVTVVGPPGIGKSRLAAELAAAVDGDATVVVGRCPAYGEGIAYRPLAEIVAQLGELRDLVDGPTERRVRAAIGLADEPAQLDETFWAIRRLLVAAARDRPLLAAIDDVHWAEPTLLDLLDSIVGLSTGAPILLLCLARPELLERRPNWAAPHPSRSIIVLEPLNDTESHQLVEALDAVEAARIVETAEGNPLFLEQLAAASTERELATLPPTIEAVLAARIDGLEPGEREVLAHASVEGRSFHRGALAELISEHKPVEPALLGLVRKQLIRPERPERAGDDGFRFAHALIREVAYNGLPKRLRADLHERLAHWLKTRPRIDEVLGYHLEQAYRHRVDVGCAGERERALAAEASERLAAAASAALTRGDAAAAARLLERAAALVPGADPSHPALLVTLGETLVEAGRLADADRVLEQAIEHGDARVASRARVEQQLARLHAGTAVADARRVADAALARHGDDLGRCRAWKLRAWIEWTESHAARADDAWRRAGDHARRAGDERELFEILGWRASAAVFGPLPVPDAIRRCTAIRERVERSPVAVAVTLHPLALLHAMTGDFDLARELIREGNAILGELGRMESAVSHHEAHIELLAGRPATAEERLRPGYEALDRMGERALLATTAAMLAKAVYEQGRWDEAAALCDVSERVATAEDVTTHVMWRGVRAKLLARDGDFAQAEALSAEAVRLAEPTDLITDRGDAHLDLAEIARLGGRAGDAEASARRGLDLYERKGNLVSAARARLWLNAPQRHEAAHQ